MRGKRIPLSLRPLLAAGALLAARAPAQSDPPSLPGAIHSNAAAGCCLGAGEPRPPVWTWDAPGGMIRTFQVSIAGFRAEATPQGYVLSVPGQPHPPRPGVPDVTPVVTTLAGVAGCTARVDSVRADWQEATGIRAAPAEGRRMDDVTTNAPTYRTVREEAPAVYAADAFWPPELAVVNEAWMGTQKVVRIQCAMLQVNPARRAIRYTLRLTGRLVFEPDETQAQP